MTSSYILCDTEELLDSALEALHSASSPLIFDCEGLQIGYIGGKLALLSLRTTPPAVPQTFLIDILTLSNFSLRPLFNILESPSITKVVFDGRMDYTALYHEYGVELAGVLDLQLADVQSRALRGERTSGQLWRLSPFIDLDEVLGDIVSFKHIHKLAGLGQCIQEHGVQGRALRSSVDHGSWVRRPLLQQNLGYAALDVYLINLLYDKMKARGYIGKNLGEQSMRYISVWKSGQPNRSDGFKSHPLLMLGILEHTDDAVTRNCIGCSRALPETAFSYDAWNDPLERRCFVCSAIYNR